MTYAKITAGVAAPLGATVTEDGVNFAVFSQNATDMVLCLFDEGGAETKIALPERDGDVWHGHVAGLAAGQRYGFRAEGPYRPEDGHRFNANKLLLDPYARAITGHAIWDDAVFGFEIGHPSEDLSFDTRDSAPFMPKAIVSDYSPDAPHLLQTDMSQSVIYEAHIRGLTCGHPEIELKGTFSGLTDLKVLDHLTNLGVTAIELLPSRPL